MFDAAISTIMKNPAGTSSSADSQSDRENENAIRRDAEADRRDRDPAAEPADVPPQREHRRAGERAHARRRHQQAVRIRSAMQDAVRDDRHQHAVGHAHQAHEAEEQQQRANRFRVPRIGKALDDAVPGRHRARARASLASTSHHEQRADHRHVADRVQQKAPALADSRDDQAGDAGTDDPRAVQHRGVQRDRVDDVVAVDHLDEERLPRRDVERVGDAEQRRQHEDVPDLNDVRRASAPARANASTIIARLRRDQARDGGSARSAIDAAERREHEDRNLPGEPDQAEQAPPSRSAGRSATTARPSASRCRRAR